MSGLRSRNVWVSRVLCVYRVLRVFEGAKAAAPGYPFISPLQKFPIIPLIRIMPVIKSREGLVSNQPRRSVFVNWNKSASWKMHCLSKNVKKADQIGFSNSLRNDFFQSQPNAVPFGLATGAKAASGHPIATNEMIIRVFDKWQMIRTICRKSGRLLRSIFHR